MSRTAQKSCFYPMEEQFTKDIFFYKLNEASRFAQKTRVCQNSTRHGGEDSIYKENFWLGIEWNIRSCTEIIFFQLDPHCHCHSHEGNVAKHVCAVQIWIFISYQNMFWKLTPSHPYMNREVDWYKWVFCATMGPRKGASWIP